MVHAGAGDTASNPRPGVHFNALGLDGGEFSLQAQVDNGDIQVSWLPPARTGHA